LLEAAGGFVRDGRLYQVVRQGWIKIALAQVGSILQAQVRANFGVAQGASLPQQAHKHFQRWGDWWGNWWGDLPSDFPPHGGEGALIE
jgi:hypothetical protein